MLPWREAMLALMRWLGGGLVVFATLVSTGCKPKLHTFTVEERIAADARKPGRLPQEALHCQVIFGGTIQVHVVELRDDYRGVVHLRATETQKPCDADFDFEMARVDPPPGHRRRGSVDLDIESWEVTRLTPRH